MKLEGELGFLYDINLSWIDIKSIVECYFAVDIFCGVIGLIYAITYCVVAVNCLLFIVKCIALTVVTLNAYVHKINTS